MNEERKEDREDLAWLEASEKGESELPPIDPARAETYQRMQLEISSLPELIAPDDGWEDAIYDELDRQDRLARNDDASRKSQRSIALLNATTAVEADAKSAGEEKRSADDDRAVPITRISDAKKPKRSWIAIGSAAAALAAVAVGAVFVKKSDPKDPIGELAGGAVDPAGGRNLGGSAGTIAEMPMLEGPVAMVLIGETKVRSAQGPRRGSVKDRIKIEMTAGRGELRLYLGKQIFDYCAEACAKPAGDGQWKYALTSKALERGDYTPVFIECNASRGDINADLRSCEGRRSLGDEIIIR